MKEENQPVFELLKDMVYTCNRKIDELSAKLDVYHAEHVQQTNDLRADHSQKIHDLQIKNESYETKFKTMAWLFSSGGVFGAALALKDLFIGK
jgi:hypothetical protein